MSALLRTPLVLRAPRVYSRYGPSPVLRALILLLIVLFAPVFWTIHQTTGSGFAGFEFWGRVLGKVWPGGENTILEISNDGHAGPHDANRGFGIGLRSIEGRLHELVDPRCRLELTEQAGETIARILVPREIKKEEAA